MLTINAVGQTRTGEHAEVGKSDKEEVARGEGREHSYAVVS